MSAELRDRIRLKPGDGVLVTLAGDRRILIEPVPDDPIEATCGMLRGERPLTEALLRERREEYGREEKTRARFLRRARVPRQGKGLREG